MTGRPSKDKPWLKYYSQGAIDSPLPKCTMYQHVVACNEGFEGSVALEYFGRRITYGEFLSDARRAASALHELGIAVGDTVTIMSMHTPEMLVAFYALNYLGACANFDYLTLSVDELAKSVETTRSKALLVLDLALERVCDVAAQLGIPVVVLEMDSSMPTHVRLGYRLKSHVRRRRINKGMYRWYDLVARAPRDVPACRGDGTSPAAIVYTSGSSGVPKGVVLSNGNLNAVTSQLTRTDRNYRRGETNLHTLPVFVGFGIGMLHHGLCIGMHTHLAIAPSVDAIGEAFAQVRPNRFVAGPSVLASVMKNTRGSLAGLVDFTGGGEAISPEREDEFNRFLAEHGSRTRYYAGYGMSEFGSVVTLNMDSAHRRGSVGVPLVSVNVRVVDTETGEELGYDEDGELCFSAPNAMVGYLKDNEATARVVEVDDEGNRWLHTEDLGHVDEDGFVFVTGRLKRFYNTVASDGSIVKIYPQRVEDLLSSDDEVEACAVVARKDATREHVPVAFIVLRDGASRATAVERLMSSARDSLPEYDVPAEIRVLESMPHTATGKIDYQALEKEAAR